MFFSEKKEIITFLWARELQMIIYAMTKSINRTKVLWGWNGWMAAKVVVDDLIDGRGKLHEEWMINKLEKSMKRELTKCLTSVEIQERLIWRTVVSTRCCNPACTMSMLFLYPWTVLNCSRASRTCSAWAMNSASVLAGISSKIDSVGLGFEFL